MHKTSVCLGLELYDLTRPQPGKDNAIKTPFSLQHGLAGCSRAEIEGSVQDVCIRICAVSRIHP